MNPDVVIVGGSVVGSSVAVHLLQQNPGLDVCVVEADATYARASAPLASGGVRQLFGLEENVRLSQYTLDVIQRWGEFLGSSVEAPALDWKQHGYLVLANHEREGQVRAQQEFLVAKGVDCVWVESRDLGDVCPGMSPEGLSGALLSPKDGWLDPNALLWGLRRAATQLGARYVEAEVVDIKVGRRRVSHMVLDSGESLIANVAYVNAAGAWAPSLAQMVGMYLPVEPMKRLEHFVEIPEELAEKTLTMPFVIDPVINGRDRLAIRREGDGFSVGLTNPLHPGGLDMSVDSTYFTNSVWPELVRRFPDLDQLRERNSWAGLYDQNRMDGNAIIGNWPGRLENFFVATGFSGHGVMHALGVGRAIAELIVSGGFVTLDLERLSYQRILEHEPLVG